MNWDDLDEDVMELGAVSAVTGAMTYGVDEYRSGLFIAYAGLARD